MLEHGAIIIDGNQTASTIQCCHCGNHYIPKPGSGIRRGFCTKCMRPTCGSAKCHICMPFEKQLDLMENIHGMDKHNIKGFKSR